jgi:RNA polymerase sigma-70 factor (ECF subfamily)
MAFDAQSDGQSPESYRKFLEFLANLRLDPRLRRRFDPEDFVQKTLLAAHAACAQLRTMNELQQKAWLRETLLNEMKNALRDATTQKRDMNRDLALDDIIENSSLRLEAVLAAEQSSPSEKAHRNEMALRLDETLQELPERQREAVVLKHYHGWTLAEISRHLNVTQLAVVGLLHRGLLKLRDLLPNPE